MLAEMLWEFIMVNKVMEGLDIRRFYLESTEQVRFLVRAVSEWDRKRNIWRKQ